MPNPLGRALRNRRAGEHTLVWAGHVIGRARLDGTYEIR